MHLLVNFPPKVAISRLVNNLKGVSSRLIRKEFPELERHYWQAKRLWSGPYFAGSVGGAPISVLKQYIEQQEYPVENGPLSPWRASRRGASPPPSRTAHCTAFR